MKLRDFLLHETRVGDIVVIREHGWQVGMTRIDNEDLYIYSLNPLLLDMYDVICFTHEKRDWATKDVTIVDIRMNQGDE
jgi:hypothetical protein